MQRSQNNHLTMDLSTQVVLNENKSKFDAYTVYTSKKEALDSSIAAEQTLANDQQEHKQVSTAAKNFAKKEAGENILDLIRRISAFAIISENHNLYDIVNFTASAIKRLSDNALATTLATVLSTASEYHNELLEYGVTDQLLQDVERTNARFNSEIQKLLLNDAELKQITKELDLQFKITDGLFIPIDAMVETMRTADPVFYRLYRNARQIKNIGGTKLSARGQAYDAITLLPMPKVKLILTSELLKVANAGSELTKTVKYAGAKGGFNLKSLPTGTYQLLASYSGYADQLQTVYINEGVLTQIQVPLSRLVSAA